MFALNSDYTAHVLLDIAVISSGFFAVSVVTIAWTRLRAWRTMPDAEFEADFARTIHVADKLQPSLLLIAVASTIGIAFTSHGLVKTLAIAAVVAQCAILILSLSLLVPLQRRIIAAYKNKTVAPATLHAMRRRWCTGHLGRSVVTIAMVFLVLAVFLVKLGS